MRMRSKVTTGLLLLAAATVGRATQPTNFEEWTSAYKTGIVCEDMPDAEPFKCDDGIEKAMREAAAQLPALPKGVVIQAMVFGRLTSKDPYDYQVFVAVFDDTGAHSRSVGYAVNLHCTLHQETACGRSAIYRGYLTWEEDGYVAEGEGKKRP